MSPTHALFGLVVVAIPTAAIVFALAAMGVNHFRKPPEERRKYRKRPSGGRRPGSKGNPQP